MEETLARPVQATGDAVSFACRDGYRLHGHLWPAEGRARGTVIVNPATGVLARYYHPYARYLAGHGFSVLTYDYRGIGASRPPRLRGAGFIWRDWGEYDVDAAIVLMRGSHRTGPLAIVGHSIGGFLPGLAPQAKHVDRILTVAGQYAYWRDYAATHRRSMLLRWHVAMPLLTALYGYFPGRRLGWLEDLPAGVAYEWSFRRRRFEMNYPRGDRPLVLARFAAVRADMLAIGFSDDPYGPPGALRRTLDYYTHARIDQIALSPADLGCEAVGHFGPFHSRLSETFWPGTRQWLVDGSHPWPGAVLHRQAARSGTLTGGEGTD